MQNYYIPHKLSIGDITHLADNDSRFAIELGIKEEDLLRVTSPSGTFHAQVTFLEKNSVEVEILKQINDTVKELDLQITIIQGVSHISKFGVFLEKITEIGVNEIIPLQCEYSIIKPNQATKESKLWSKIVKDATEQSRNPNPPVINQLITIKDLKTTTSEKTLKLCFATENIATVNLKTLPIAQYSSIEMAFGPESGWSFDELNLFKQMDFQFVRLSGNILRTETTPLVATSIIKFLHNQL
ncbi:16S rRNA (uracil(1498)-N(3))-methyltransferase [bacterium]|nr:16S rRNA (uracil(1498)-N(3))-methyltransferase [bacterium]